MAPNDKVSAPKIIKYILVNTVNSNKIANLIIKKTPATTKVEEWINAEAGVGASIASGSQTWKKNCAALIAPEVTRQNEKRVKKCTATFEKNI